MNFASKKYQNWIFLKKINEFWVIIESWFVDDNESKISIFDIIPIKTELSWMHTWHISESKLNHLYFIFHLLRTMNVANKWHLIMQLYMNSAFVPLKGNARNLRKRSEREREREREKLWAREGKQSTSYQTHCSKKWSDFYCNGATWLWKKLYFFLHNVSL